MSNQMMTLKKLAELSNFSVSTVSKALADNPEISIKTKNKIKKLAEFYNYKPNITAKNLKERKTRAIGVIIPNILAHFFAKVLSGIEKEAREKGYNIITCISDESFEKEVKSIEMLANGSVDGFIISISKETFVKENYKHLQGAIDKGLPISMFDRVIDRVYCDKVVINDFQSSYTATEKLIKSGCKNVIFVTPIHHTSVGLDRVSGYEKALKDILKRKGKPKVLVIEDYQKFTDSFTAFLKDNKVDGVVAADELSGIYTMNLLIGAGHRVPEDVSVIGFTDGILAGNSNPPLTTVDQRAVELGKVAANNIISRLEDNQKEAITYETTVLETYLIERGSTKFK